MEDFIGTYILELVSSEENIVEYDVLMPPNLCGKPEDFVVGCACFLVDFNLLIHSLR